jgi:hypothetical protein
MNILEEWKGKENRQATERRLSICRGIIKNSPDSSGLSGIRKVAI